MEQVNRSSKVPLYHQLYEILRRNISRNEWQPGDKLPSESSLVEQYEISRVTVRQALEELVKEGLIYRQPGRGTFVAEPAVEETLTRIVSFTEDMELRGLEPRSEVLFSDLVPSPKDIAEKLEIQPGEELARLDRLRLADGAPLSVEESHLIHRYCPDVLEGDYTSASLRQTLERDYGIRLVSATQMIRAIAATERLTELLSISARQPLLFIERVTHSQQDVPVEFLRIYYRGDRYSLYNELQG